MTRLTIHVPDATMSTYKGRRPTAAASGTPTVPCTLVLTVDAELLAAFAVPSRALIAEAEGRRAS